MTSSVILSYTIKAMLLILVTSLPAIIVASIVGVLVSLLQAVTQIQDQTVSFALKLIAIIITIILTAGWAGGQLLHFANNLFDLFPALIKS